MLNAAIISTQHVTLPSISSNSLGEPIQCQDTIFSQALLLVREQMSPQSTSLHMKFDFILFIGRGRERERLSGSK